MMLSPENKRQVSHMKDLPKIVIMTKLLFAILCFASS